MERKDAMENATGTTQNAFVSEPVPTVADIPPEQRTSTTENKSFMNDVKEFGRGAKSVMQGTIELLKISLTIYTGVFGKVNQALHRADKAVDSMYHIQHLSLSI